METLTLEQWMRQEGYHTTAEIKERVFINGGNESDVDAEMSPIHDAYNDYLEELNTNES